MDGPNVNKVVVAGKYVPISGALLKIPLFSGFVSGRRKLRNEISTSVASFEGLKLRLWIARVMQAAFRSVADNCEAERRYEIRASAELFLLTSEHSCESRSNGDNANNNNDKALLRQFIWSPQLFEIPRKIGAATANLVIASNTRKERCLSGTVKRA
jgi:hypothetical protein